MKIATRVAGALAVALQGVMVGALVVTALGIPTPEAKTLRWASRGDIQTMDPYSQN